MSPAARVGLLLLAVLAAAAVLWPQLEQRPAPPAATLPPAVAPPATSASGGTPPDVRGAVVQSAPPLPASAVGQRSARGIFHSDADGRLVVDQRMRLAVEALVGQNPAHALPGLIDAEVKDLPPAAAQAARELTLRFDEYQAAQRAAFTPGKAPLVPQEGLAELDALTALRTSYFGADAARRMFGAEEAVSRRLLQLMAEDKDTNLSMEQKAMRAQLQYDRERGAVPKLP